MKKILLGIFVAISLSVYAADRSSSWNWNNTVSPASPAEKAIKAAKAENKKAKAVSFEWRDTAKMLKKATKMAGKNPKGAIKLANKAKRQAINAQNQAREQSNAGPKF